MIRNAQHRLFLSTLYIGHEDVELVSVEYDLPVIYSAIGDRSMLLTHLYTNTPLFTSICTLI